MSKEVKVSVIMSVYNEEEYLQKGIESIISQDFRDWELIVINDGSSDNSLNIIKNFLRKDNRIKFINNSANLGLTRSLNKGIKLSQGKYIARQDADDVSLSNRLKIQYDFLEKNPEVFLVSSSSVLIDKKGNKIGVERAYLNPVRAKRKITVANCITHSSIFFRANKKIFYRNKFKYCQDYDLYLRLLTQGKKIFQLKNFLVKHRLKEESISQQKKKEQLAYSKVARFFYREREKTGKDSYSSFNPKNITSNITREIEQEATKRKIIFYLRNDSYSEAEKAFKIYSAKSVKKIDLNKIALFLFIKIPFLYTIYRKVFNWN